RGVEKLPPGHWLELDIPTGEIRSGCYSTFEFSPDPTLGEKEAAQRLVELLAEATALRLRADVPVAVFLSGGLDSATIAALSRRLGEEPKLLFVDLGDAGEKRRATATAASLGLSLEVIPGEKAPDYGLLPKLAEVFDEPLADPSVVPTYFVAQAASAVVKVVLNGDGGDELLAGYRRFLLAAAAENLSARWALRVGLAALGLVLRKPWLSRRFREGLGDPSGGYLAWGPVKFTPKEVASFLGREPDVSSVSRVLAHAPEGSAVNRLRALELFFFLPGDLLVKMDRATMACSLEARSPFLDQEVVRFSLTVPPKLLLSPFRTKLLLRRATRGFLPEEVRRGPKRGFEPPLPRWLAGPWAREVKRVLNDPRCSLRGFLRMGPLVKTLNTLAAADPPRHARAVFTILTLEHWLSRWG
ncbi:MAG: asparagine synthetase B family protein, partial [Thermoanaerobaculum sp.]